MSTTSPVKYGIAGIAAVVIAVGAYSIGSTGSGDATSGAANVAGAAQGGRVPPGQAQGGQAPRGGPSAGQAPPGFGSPVTGATADKAKAAALAKYKGSVEQVMKLDNGSYVVHVITSKGEYHVAVSKDFRVTGADQGGPGGGAPGSAAPGSAAPGGAPPGSSSGTTN